VAKPESIQIRLRMSVRKDRHPLLYEKLQTVPAEERNGVLMEMIHRYALHEKTQDLAQQGHYPAPRQEVVKEEVPEPPPERQNETPVVEDPVLSLGEQFNVLGLASFLDYPTTSSRNPS